VHQLIRNQYQFAGPLMNQPGRFLAELTDQLAGA